MTEQQRIEMESLPEDVQQAFMMWCLQQDGVEEPEDF